MARIAILDANVLWPQYLRDVLISAAVFDAYRAAWTDEIINEMRNSLVREGRVSPEQIDRTVRFMRDKMPHFWVEGYESLIPIMTNHLKDRHVLAAAVRAGADTIVTENWKHFPLQSRAPYGIEILAPDEFLLDLWVAEPERVARAIVTMAARLHKPPVAPHELVETYLARHAPAFAQEVRKSDALQRAAQAVRDGVPLPHFPLL